MVVAPTGIAALNAGGQTIHKFERLQGLKDMLPNLQLLECADNQSKNGQMPADWIEATFKTKQDRQDYIERHLLDGIMTGLGFEASYDARRNRLKEIREVLNAGNGLSNGPLSPARAVSVLNLFMQHGEDLPLL